MKEIIQTLNDRISEFQQNLFGHHELVEPYKSKISTAQRLSEYYRQMHKDTRFKIAALDNKIIVCITRLEELPMARAYARSINSEFVGDLAYIWASGGNGMASWETTGVPIEIWLSTPVEDFPRELMGDSCEFKKITSEEYRYACERSK